MQEVLLAVGGRVEVMMVVGSALVEPEGSTTELDGSTSLLEGLEEPDGSTELEGSTVVDGSAELTAGSVVSGPDVEAGGSEELGGSGVVLGALDDDGVAFWVSRRQFKG